MSRSTFLLVLALTLAGFRPAPAETARTPQVFFMIGESEYDTAKTLPAFAKAELEPAGIRCTFSILPDEKSEEFPNFDALKDADLLFISVRRHAPPPAQMALIRAHVVAGKPVVGIRTASHAFGKRKGETEGAWEHFDTEVLGGNYHDHYGKGIATFAKIVPEAAGHPVLAGIGAAEFRVPSHLYKNPDLPPTVTKLLTARMEGRPEVEPVAWVNTAHGRRVFYTSLGSPEDFEVPQFRRLLFNGIRWALGLPAAPGG
jgi:type 1 glutamine amidotransferase